MSIYTSFTKFEISATHTVKRNDISDVLKTHKLNHINYYHIYHTPQKDTQQMKSKNAW